MQAMVVVLNGIRSTSTPRSTKYVVNSIAGLPLLVTHILCSPYMIVYHVVSII